MSVVDQQNVPPPSSSSTTTTKIDPSPAPGPPILTLDFSANPILRQVTTLLRRVWLLDPPLSDEELADAKTVQQCLQSVTQIVGEEFSSSAPSSSTDTSAAATATTEGEEENDSEQSSKKWDDEAWKLRTQFRLLSDPVVIGGDKDVEEEEESKWLKSVVSPWREEIYDVYRHVFADLWRMVVKSSSAVVGSPTELGVFEPTRGNAVSVAALPSTTKDATTTTTTSTTTTSSSFQTDTFLYPVWVNPKATIKFSVEDAGKEEQEGEEKHRWTAGEAKTWTTGLWVRAGKTIVVKTEIDQAGDAEKTGLAAVFVTGHCDERKKE